MKPLQTALNDSLTGVLVQEEEARRSWSEKWSGGPTRIWQGRHACKPELHSRLIFTMTPPYLLPGSLWLNPLCAGSGEAGTIFARFRGGSGRSGNFGNRFIAPVPSPCGTHLMERRSPDGLPGVFHMLYSLKTSSRCASDMSPRQKHIWHRW